MGAGLVDKFFLSVALVLFEDTGTSPITLAETIASTDVTHIRYTVNG